MELINVTNVTKTAEIRVSRSIGALLIKSDSTLANLVNESITVFVERANGSNDQIATNVKLKDFILASTFGKAAIDNTGGLSAVCEISEGGAIRLGENEGIKVQLNGLRTAQAYEVHGIEYPVLQDIPCLFDTKKVLTEEQSRLFEVKGYELAVFEGADAIEEIHLGYNNGSVVKMTGAELKAVAFDVDPVQEYGASTVTQNATAYGLPLVGVNSMDVYKTTAKALTITLKSLTADDVQLS